MISLFIDTSTSNVSISVIKDNKILSYINKETPNMHSVYTTKFVKDALDEAKIDANDVDNIMVVNGPGSFTGVRIGVTIAKTYGYLIKKDLTLLSSLKDLAISANCNDVVMSVIPANKSMYYVGIYDKEYNDIEEEKCMKKEDVLFLCNKYNPYIVSISTSVIGSYKVNKQEIDPLKIVEYYLNKEKVSYHKALPNYLKQPQAVEAKND
jgi:tRNA threonylcarbamoyl adenosine modification protein YeaZ